MGRYLVKSILIIAATLVVLSGCNSDKLSGFTRSTEQGSNSSATPTLETNNPMDLGKGTSSNLTDSSLSATDDDSQAAELTYRITQIPLHGDMRLNGVILTITSTFTQADLNQGLLSYHHNGSDTATDTFSFVIVDKKGVSTGDIIFNINIRSTNSAPTISTIANQAINENSNTGALSLTINDSDNNLNCANSITGSSSNGTLVPNSNIVFAGTAPNCMVTVTPAANQFGIATISLVVSDGALTDQEDFSLIVSSLGGSPTISDISNQVINKGSHTGALAFTINDSETALDCSSSMTGTSSNTVTVPNANIVFAGTAPNCTVTITPPATQIGTVTITLEVSDGTFTSQDTFSLTVNSPPTISDVTDQSINVNTSTGALALTIGDIDDTLSCSSSLSGTSSNTTLVPNANIVFAGTAPNCTVTITPAASQSGTSTITLTLSDGTATAQDTFDITAVSSQNWYVRKTGNNGNNCTSAATACLTIQAAENKADDDSSGANDTIYVGAGIYNEGITLSHGGASDGSRYKIIADTTGAQTGDAGAVILDGTGLSSSMDAFQINSGNSFINIDGFTIQNFSGTAKGIDSTSSTSNGINLTNLTLFNNVNANIDISGDNCTLQNIKIFDFGSAPAIKIGSAADNTTTLTDIDIKNGSGFGIDSDGSATYSNIRVENTLIGFDVNKDPTVSNMQIYSSQSEGMNVHGAGGSYSNILIANSGTDGLKVSNGSTFNHMTIYGSTGNGLLVSSSSTTFNNSIIMNSGNFGIQCSSCSIFSHINNLLWNNTSGDVSGTTVHGSELQSDPLFLNAGNNYFKYQQTLSGQGADSPAIDAGSDTAANLNIDTFTTRSDNAVDTGTADIGYHYPATNITPIGTTDVLNTTMNNALVINKAADLLANDIEIESEALSITSFDATSILGGTITDGGATLTYTPPASFEGVDTFFYTLSDGTDTDTALVVISVAAITTYYVRTTGNNGNNCTSAGTACASIAGALGKMTYGANKTIYVGGGTFNTSQLAVNVKATPAQPLNIIADTTGAQTGDAGTVTLDASGSNRVLYIQNSEFVTFDGFSLTGAASATLQIGGGSQYLTFSNLAIDASIANGGIVTGGNGNNLFQNITVEGGVMTGITTSGDNDTFKNILVYLFVNNGVENYGDNNTFQNMTINGVMGGADLFVQGSGSAALKDSILSSSIFGAGINVTGGTLTHTYNILWDNTFSGNYLGTTAGTGEVSANPLFINAASDNFRLQHIAAGQASDSPAIDAGSQTAVSAEVNTRSTRSDAVSDSGTVDMGYHY